MNEASFAPERADEKVGELLEQIMGCAMETWAMTDGVLTMLTGKEPTRRNDNEPRARCVIGDLVALRQMCREIQGNVKWIIDRL